jgi:hypothetical protein
MKKIQLRVLQAAFALAALLFTLSANAQNNPLTLDQLFSDAHSSWKGSDEYEPVKREIQSTDTILIRQSGEKPRLKQKIRVRKNTSRQEHGEVSLITKPDSKPVRTFRYKF